MKYVCFFDGACEPRNPGGNMGIGAVIMNEDGVQLHTHSHYVPATYQNSNNVAEYMGFICTVKKLQEILTPLPPEIRSVISVEIYGDSKLVVEQMNGRWQIKHGRYKPYALQAAEALETLHTLVSSMKIKWIPREQNGYADELSKACMIKNNCEFKIQPNL